MAEQKAQGPPGWKASKETQPGAQGGGRRRPCPLKEVREGLTERKARAPQDHTVLEPVRSLGV